MRRPPPYRFSNPRYLDTGYGVSASGALQWSPRAFRYFTTLLDNHRALDALSVLLWPGNHSEAERDAAMADLEALKALEGELWIEDGATAMSPVEGSREIIEWIQFRVRICTAGDVKGLRAWGTAAAVRSRPVILEPTRWKDGVRREAIFIRDEAWAHGSAPSGAGQGAVRSSEPRLAVIPRDESGWPRGGSRCFSQARGVAPNPGTPR
jgi:hypothetical protein